MQTEPKYPLKAWLALGAVCLIWGTTYLANKVGVGEMPPLLFSSVRMMAAGLIVLAYFGLRNQIPWSDRSYLMFQTGLGVLMLGIGNGIGMVALTWLDSGIASLISASTPFLIVLFNNILRAGDPIRLVGWIGISMGMGGIVFLSWDNIQLNGDVGFGWGVFFLMLALVGWALGSVISKKRLYPYPIMVAAGFQMLAGGLSSLILSLPFERTEDINLSSELMWSLSYLIVFGSLVAYSSYLYALSKLPATIVSLYAYINPLLALIAGWLFLKERLDYRIGIAAAMILSGVWLINHDLLTRRESHVDK